MKDINPKIILPIIALLIMVAQEATGIKFDATELQIINDGILAIIAMAGIFSNPSKEKTEEES